MALDKLLSGAPRGDLHSYGQFVFVIADDDPMQAPAATTEVEYFEMVA